MAKTRKKSPLLAEGGNAYQMAKIINVDNLHNALPLMACDGTDSDSVREQCTALGASLWLSLAEIKRGELLHLQEVEVAEKQADNTFVVNIDLLKKLVWHSLLHNQNIQELVNQFIDIESQELQTYEDKQENAEEPVFVRQHPKPTIKETTRWGGGL